jgi:hypothetical protein
LDVLDCLGPYSTDAERYNGGSRRFAISYFFIFRRFLSSSSQAFFTEDVLETSTENQTDGYRAAQRGKWQHAKHKTTDFAKCYWWLKNKTGTSIEEKFSG